MRQDFRDRRFSAVLFVSKEKRGKQGKISTKPTKALNVNKKFIDFFAKPLTFFEKRGILYS